MRHQARVQKDAIGGTKAWVAVEGMSACQRCAKGEGCGAGLFNQGSQSVSLECHTALTVHAGQAVTIEHDDADSRWLWAVAGAYGLPTLGLLGACLLADWLVPASSSSVLAERHAAGRDGLVGLLSLAGLAGGVIAWRTLAPFTLTRVQTGPCLQSARIVAVDQPTSTPSRESRNES